MESFNLWKKEIEHKVTIDYYKPLQKANDVAVVIFPGGEDILF